MFFGQNATDEERDQLQIQRSKFLEETYILKESGDFNAAMVAAVNAQFCREALCANTTPELVVHIKDLVKKEKLRKC